MKDRENLEDTLPIKTLDSIKMTREEKNEKINTGETREFKYKEMIEQQNKEAASELEAAEEALAEKNIEKAESLLEEEKKEPVSEGEPEGEKKQNFIKRAIEKFKSLPKKKKILIIILAILVLILLIIGIVFLCTRKKDSVSEEPEVVEEATAIVDNFYYQNGNLYFLDDNGKEIGTYACENKDANLCYVAINNYRDDFDVAEILDEKGEEKVKHVPIVNEEFVFVEDHAKDEKRVLLYSIETKEVLEEYNDVKAYDDNYFVVSDDKDLYGYIQIDKAVQNIISFNYKYLGKIDSEENLVAQKGNSYIILSKDGKEVSSNISSSATVKDYSSSLIVIKNGSSYSVMNYKGENLIDNVTYARTDDSYFSFVRDKQLYVRDASNNKYHEDGYALKNTDYVQKFIFDDNGKLKDNLRSYEISTEGDTIEISIYNSDSKDPKFTKIKKAVAEVNSKYTYINYFDDSLYFYKDDSKDDLLGKYSCSNKNSVESSSSVLDICYVANDTIYEDTDEITSAMKERKTTIPLINNRFVFIKDGGSTVNLYDLVDKKTLGTYASVNSYLDNNDNTFKMYSGNISFIALNKKGKYGMVALSGSSASSVYPFEYEKMEKLGSYVLAQNSDKKWQILYSQDEKSALYPGKVQEVTTDKKYYKVSSGDAYMIYSNGGTPVSSETYVKAKLYNSFYAGVTSKNELYVYDYTGTKLTEPIKVSSTSCSAGELFSVSAANSMYRVSLCEGDSYKVYSPELAKGNNVVEKNE